MPFISLRDLPDADRRVLCLRLHREIMLPAFPLSAELEESAIWMDLMSKNLPPPAPRLHVIVRVADDKTGVLIGGVVCEAYRKSRAGLVTYIAVAPDRRRSGVGRRLMEAALKALASDAGTGDSPVFAEVEIPDRAPKTAGEGIDHWTRLGVLQRLGFAKTELPYVQPSLAPGKPPLDWLCLAVHRASIPAGAESLPADRMRSFLDEFYRSLHADPRTDKAFAAMGAWLDRHPNVTLLPMDPR